MKSVNVTKHTPGPWIFDKTNYGMCPFEGWGIIPADMMSPAPAHVPYIAFDSTFTKAQAEANARLIASAPDLYDALTDLVEACPSGFGNDRALNEALLKAETVLGKVKV